AELNHVPIPPDFDGTIEKMLEVTSAFADAGHLPQFGDDDGGRVFDPSRNWQKHLFDPLVIGAALYNRGDFKAENAHATEELLWLLGTRGLRQYKELPQAPGAKQPEQLFSGVSVLCLKIAPVIERSSDD